MALRERKMEMVKRWSIEDLYRVAKQLGIQKPEEFDDNYELATLVVDKMVEKTCDELIANPS